MLFRSGTGGGLGPGQVGAGGTEALGLRSQVCVCSGQHPQASVTGSWGAVVERALREEFGERTTWGPMAGGGEWQLRAPAELGAVREI